MATRRLKAFTAVSLSVFLMSALNPFGTAPFLPAAVAEVIGAEQKITSPLESQVTSSEEDFSQQYTALTKKILLSGIELERFNLNYRLNVGKQPSLRKLRYFLAQETGAGCGLAFDITAMKEFSVGRRRPLRISQSALHGAFATAMVGSIVAGSGSALELTLNAVQSAKNRKNGFDSKSATKFVLSRLKQIDQLLAQREALVASNSTSLGYNRAVLEGKVLQGMRNAFVQEYSEFNTNSAHFMAFQNAFYALNAAYSAIGAASSAMAYKGITQPKFNGTANILFIVAGATASVSPLLSSTYGAVARRIAANKLAREFGGKPQFDLDLLTADRKKLEAQMDSSVGTLIPSFPATQRLALFTESDQLFRKQLLNETKTIQRLEKVALQTCALGPLIGGALMTQGILGTRGYYKYPLRPRRQLNQLYYGSVVGTVGFGAQVIGNAAWLLASWSYEQRLSKKNQLPGQLIKDRLEHLKELEQTVSAL